MHPHDHGDRHRQGDRDRPPRTGLERVDHHQCQDGDEHDHNPEHGHQRRVAGHRPHFVVRHLAERASVAPRGGAENHEVLYGAAQCDAHDDPQRAGEKSELGGQRRPDQRAGSRDGGKVVAEDDPPIGWAVVAAILEPQCRRPPCRIEREHLRGDELRVEAIGDRIGADGGREQPDGADRLATRQREPGDGTGAEGGDGHRDECAEQAGHDGRTPRRGKWELAERDGRGQRSAIVTSHGAGSSARWKLPPISLLH